jgi:hypothetical protein
MQTLLPIVRSFIACLSELRRRYAAATTPPAPVARMHPAPARVAARVAVAPEMPADPVAVAIGAKMQHNRRSRTRSPGALWARHPPPHAPRSRGESVARRGQGRQGRTLPPG